MNRLAVQFAMYFVHELSGVYIASIVMDVPQGCFL